MLMLLFERVIVASPKHMFQNYIFSRVAQFCFIHSFYDIRLMFLNFSHCLVWLFGTSEKKKDLKKPTEA